MNRLLRFSVIVLLVLTGFGAQWPGTDEFHARGTTAPFQIDQFVPRGRITSDMSAGVGFDSATVQASAEMIAGSGTSAETVRAFLEASRGNARPQNIMQPVEPEMVVFRPDPVWCTGIGGDPMQGLSMFLASVLQLRSMLVVGDIAIVPSLTDPYGLVGLDVQTGDELWETVLGPSASFHFGMQIAAVPGSDLAIWVVEDGLVGAIDIDSGEVAWTADLHGMKSFASAIDGNDLYVAGKEIGIVALDATSGAIQWNALGAANSGPVVVVDDATILAGLDDGAVVALDRSTGAELWRQIVAPDMAISHFGWAWTGASTDGVALLLEWKGVSSLEGMELYAVDTASGDTRWSLSSETWLSAPAVADGKVFVGDGGGAVLALDLSSGTEIWHQEVSGPGIGEWGFYGPSPTVFDATVVLVGMGESDDGETLGVVFGFDTVSGRSNWAIATDEIVILDTSAWLQGDTLLLRGIALEKGGPAQACAFSILDVGGGKAPAL